MEVTIRVGGPPRQPRAAVAAQPPKLHPRDHHVREQLRQDVLHARVVPPHLDEGQRRFSVHQLGRGLVLGHCWSLGFRV